MRSTTTGPSTVHPLSPSPDGTAPGGRRSRRRGSVLALLLIAFAPASAPGMAAELPSLDAVVGRYVVLGAGGGGAGAHVRVVLRSGEPCPAVRGADGAEREMTTRNNDPRFPVIVCEAELPSGGASLRLADGSLPLAAVTPNPRRVLVLGDTGCQAPHGDHPGCVDGSPAEPLASMARAAAGQPWDLIVHLGDLNYRGTSGGKRLFTVTSDDGLRQEAHWTYDAGDGAGLDAACEQAPDAGFWSQNAPDSNDPDRWETWRDDVFSPLADLLPAAPWVFVRGNHELCSRAGPGWLYFFGPSSRLGGGVQQSCPSSSAGDDPLDRVVLPPAHEIDLGDLSLVVLDSANACDFSSETRFRARYAETMGAIAALPPATGRRWLVTHRPLWAITALEAGETSSCSAANRFGCLGTTLRGALVDATGADRLPGVDLVLAGHMHQFQAVAGGEGRPPTLVVGTGGVKMSAGVVGADLVAPVGGVPTSVLSLGAEISRNGTVESSHSFLEIERHEGGGWRAHLRDRSRQIDLVECSTPGMAGEAPCRLVDGVEIVPAGDGS